MQTRRWNPSCTPPHWGWVAALVALWWFSELVGTVAYYRINQAAHTYSASADSIAIPIFGFFLASVVIVPVGGLLTWLVLRRYPGSVTLWHWEKIDPVWSGIWTLASAGLIYLIVRDPGAPTPGQWVDQTTAGFSIYLILLFRAILVARPLRPRNR